jgi:hypothetical protein
MSLNRRESTYTNGLITSQQINNHVEIYHMRIHDRKPYNTYLPSAGNLEVHNIFDDKPKKITLFLLKEEKAISGIVSYV